MDNKVITALAVAALVVGGLAFLRPATVVEKVQEVLGATSGPDRFNECESTNGIVQCFTRKGLVQATTTPCAIQAPKNASSTLSGGIRFNVASSSAINATLARSISPNATTTALQPAVAIAAGQQVTIIASSTVFAPGEWFTVGLSGALGGVSGSAPVGICQATFEVI